MEKPVIIFVHGLWEGTAPFVPIARKLHALGYSTNIATFPSLGQSSPGNANMDDDIAAVRAFIQPHVERGRKVVLVPHSFGGYVGVHARN